MRTAFSALSIAALAGLLLSGQAAAGPNFPGRGFAEFSVREDRAEREFGRRDEQEARQDSRRQDRRGEAGAANPERERGYGYGYERRNPHPRQDERGRR